MKENLVLANICNLALKHKDQVLAHAKIKM